MADTKISALPGATAATGGSVPVVQSGATKKMTVTAAGATIAEAADAAAQRTALGLGTVATLASDTDTALAANSDSRVATQKAVKAYVDGLVVGLLEFKGATDCSANPNYPSANKGDGYVVSVAGKIGGASGTVVAVGDWFIATADNAGGTQAGVGSSWALIEHRIGLGSAAGQAAPGNRQWSIDGFINSPLVKNYVISLKFPRAATIVSFSGKTTSGTVTQDIKIGSTNVTGLAAKTYDSTGETDTATAANTLAANDTLNLNISAISAPVDYAWTLTLAEAD